MNLAWSAIVVLLLAGAAPLAGSSGTTVQGCGGQAPVTTTCVIPSHPVVGVVNHGFDFPPCPAPVPVSGPCYAGVLESQLRSDYANSAVVCHAIVFPDEVIDMHCRRSGDVVANTAVSQHCFSHFWVPEGAPEQALVRGGLGSWACVQWYP